MTIASPVAAATAERLVREQFAIIETDQLELAAGNVTADFVNHRAATEPPTARGHGARRAAGDSGVAAYGILGPALRDSRDRCACGPRDRLGHLARHPDWSVCRFDPADGSVANVFPTTGRSFAARQVHWFRIVDDAIAEHEAVRDDLAMATQVGWFPPRPSYMVRMLLARRRYRRPPTPET